MQRVKQAHELERRDEPMPTPDRMFLIDEIHILSAGDRDTQIIDEVLLVVKNIQGFEIPFPLFASFKSPEALKTFIEELIAFYNSVWADAAPIDPDTRLPTQGGTDE